jgi:hypothetical protein
LTVQGDVKYVRNRDIGGAFERLDYNHPRMSCWRAFRGWGWRYLSGSHFGDLAGGWWLSFLDRGIYFEIDSKRKYAILGKFTIL